MAKSILSEEQRKKMAEQQAAFGMYQQQAEGLNKPLADFRDDAQKQAEGLENQGGRMSADEDGMAYFRKQQDLKNGVAAPEKAPEVIDYVGIEKARLAAEAALKETERRNLLERDAMNQKGPKGLSRSSKGSSFEEFTGKTKRKSLLVPLRLFK